MKAILWIALGCAVTGCSMIDSSKVDQSQIFTSYSASYSETGSQLSLSATFNVGGSTGTYVELQSPSEVTVNGQVLSKTTDIINQIIYQANDGGVSATAWQAQQIFTYTDDNGKAYVNALTLPRPVSATTANGATFSKAAGVSIGWTTANAVQSGESLTAIIQGNDQNHTQASGSSSAGGTTGTIAIDPTGLAQVPAGGATVYVCRNSSATVAQAPSVGGFATVAYCSAQVSVTLTP